MTYDPNAPQSPQPPTPGQPFPGAGGSAFPGGSGFPGGLAFPSYVAPKKRIIGKKFALIGGIIATVLGAVAIWNVSGSSNVLDTQTLIPTMESNMTQVSGEQVTVTCPSTEPLQAGYIFDCTASAKSGEQIVRVTENDAQGHIAWQVTSQDATGPDGKSN
jgi:hypothetical protein